MAELSEDGVLQLYDCLEIVGVLVFIEKVPKEEMLMWSGVRAETTQERFSADTSGNGNDSSAMPDSLGHNSSEKPRSVAMRKGFSRIRCRCPPPRVHRNGLKERHH